MRSETTLEAFRQRLIALSRRLDADRSQLKDEALEPVGGEASGGLSEVPIDPADLGTHVAEEELTLSLVGNEEELMGEIDAALARIDEGTFGRCEACGKEVSPQRLHALPYARYCFACAKNLQRKLSP
jgi:DnaK suppressor protein